MNLDKELEYINSKLERCTVEEKPILYGIRHALEYLQRITKNEHFHLDDEEAKKAHQFYLKHVKGRNFGAIGGGMVYSFMPTGLGDIVHVSTRDDHGNRIEEDITNIDNW